MLRTAIIQLATNPYVPWDVNAVKQAAVALRGNIGTIITVGLIGFFMISGIYLIVGILRGLLQ